MTDTICMCCRKRPRQPNQLKCSYCSWADYKRPPSEEDKRKVFLLSNLSPKQISQARATIRQRKWRDQNTWPNIKFNRKGEPI